MEEPRNLSSDEITISKDSVSIKLPSTDSSDALNPEFNPDYQFYLAFSSLLIVTLAAALDATSLSVALPIIAADLGGSSIEAFWAGTSFLLTSTVFQPTYASFSHIFGRKPLIFVGLTLFAIGAIVAGVAHNFMTLLIGRSIQGVGAGGIISMTEIIVTDMIPLKERGKWFGFISAMWAIGSVSGPIIGGAFAQKASWRWIFWINLPIIGIGYIMVFFFLKLQHTRTSTLSEQLKRVDWMGSIIFIGSTTSFLIPISWGGVMYSWSSWRTLVPLILGIIGMLVFIPYELYVAQEPMVRMSIFSNWSQRAVYYQTFMHGSILWSMLYYGPIYYEGVKGFSMILTGVALFPQTFTVAPASIAVGIIIAISGRYRWALWTGWFLTVLGMGLLYLEDAHTSTVAWIFLNLVPGLGTGILFAGMAIAIPASAAPKDMAHAVAFFSFFRAFGQGVGVAIGGTIFQNEIKVKLLEYPLLAPMAETYSQDASGLVTVIKGMVEGVEKSQLVQAYADSLKVVWIVMCGLAVTGLVSVAFVGKFSLDVALETEQGFVGKTKVGDAEEVREKKADSGL